MHTYRFPVTADLSKFLPTVGKVMAEVNGHMRDFGFYEKAVIRSEVMHLELTSAVQLPADILEKSRAIMEAALVAKFPDMEYEVGPPIG